MTGGHESEIERIEAEYRRRDARPGGATASMLDPAQRFYVQSLEWAVLDALAKGGFDLAAADVLDVGCGGGALTHRLAELGARSASGVDLMEHRIALARERYPGMCFERADAADLPFPDERFGLVTHFACLSSVHDPGVRTRIAAEMWRVLAPGGAVLSYDLRPSPAPVRAVGRAATRLRERRRGPADPQTPVIPLSLADVRALFPAARIEHRTAILNVALGGVARRSRLLAEALARVPLLRSHLIVLAWKPERPA